MFEDEYLVLEYCALGSLSHLLETKGNELKYEDLVSMMFEAAKGMEYLERQSVIHSDLCTHSHSLLHFTHSSTAARNLLVVKINDRYSVKVSDFGLSAISTELKRLSSVHIPVRWAAPELLERSCEYTNKSDVYR